MKFEIFVSLLITCILRNNQRCEGTSCDVAKNQEIIEHDTKVRMFHLTANIRKLRRDLDALQQQYSTRNEHRSSADEPQDKSLNHEELTKKIRQLSLLIENYETFFTKMTKQTSQARQRIKILRNKVLSIRKICHENVTIDCPINIVGVDCTDVLRKGGSYSGVYFIQPTADSIPFPAFCDQENDGGGWTYIHSHVSNELDFNRSWLSYKHGFGEVNCNGGGNFWIGNEVIHSLTSSQRYHLWVDVTDWSGNTGHARYTIFEVGSEDTEYKLHVSGYIEAEDPDMRIGDGFSGFYFGHINDIIYTSHDGMNFSTFDRDNDLYQYECAHQDGGGWWFNRCSAVNLNGRIYRNGFYRATDTLYGFDNAMIWGPWTGLWYSLKTASMKIRPAAFPN